MTKRNRVHIPNQMIHYSSVLYPNDSDSTIAVCWLLQGAKEPPLPFK